MVPTKTFQARRVSMGSRQPYNGEVQTQTHKGLSSSLDTVLSDIPREHPHLKADLKDRLLGVFLLTKCKRG